MRSLRLLGVCFILVAGLLAIVPASAQTHDQICQANRDQCLRGCDGMAQCSNACWVNYNGCLQGGR